MRVGLVLEGGAMRGMFTSGVLDNFMDEKIKVDGIIGVSAGALFGINYFSDQKQRAIRYNKKYAKDPRYISAYSYLLTGNVVNKHFSFHTINYKLDPFDNETFMKNKKDFYAGVTNVETGKAEYIKITDAFKQMEVLRATSALPLASRFVKIDNKKYLDGGISDSIPVDKFIKEGYDKIIVVLTQPYDYKKEPLSDKMLNKLNKKFKKYPKLIETMINRHETYNKNLKHIKKLEKEGKIFVIRPNKKIDINILKRTPEQLQEAYEMGLNESKKVMKDLKKYLKN